MRSHTCRGRWIHSGFRMVVLMALVLGVVTLSGAEESKWSIALHPMNVSAHGHDPHVLNVNRIDLGPPRVQDRTAVDLETEDLFTGRLVAQYRDGSWGAGVEYFQFITSQHANDLLIAADGPAGPADQIVFEIVDQSYTSTGPGEVLFYNLLEDTDLEMWTADFYGMRVLADRSHSRVVLRFGLRAGDFDNDYRAATGVQNVAGTRMDSSSNYDLMMGPYVALTGEVQRGRNEISGHFGQSLLMGTAELAGMTRDFSGPFGPMPAFFDTESIHKMQDVAIPVSEFRLGWTYRVTKLLALGLNVSTSVWWDVPVPPGVIPMQGGDGVFHENTVVLLGTGAVIEVTF